MAKNQGGTAMLVKSMGKQLRQLEANMDASTKHCKILDVIIKGKEPDLRGYQRLAKQMLKTASVTQKQVDKMYAGIRSVTAKMPREERQTSRKEIGKLLDKVDKKAALLGKTAYDMVKKVQVRQKNTPTVGPAGDILVIFLRCLQAILVICEVWKKRKKKEVG